MSFVYLSHGDDISSYKKDFIDKVSFPIVTPDGFTINCPDIDETARHICCGKSKKGPLERGRAAKILWTQVILMDKSLRRVVYDTGSRHVIFFCEKKKYLVICSRPGGKGMRLNLITAWPVSGERFVSIRDMDKGYVLFDVSK